MVLVQIRSRRCVQWLSRYQVTACDVWEDVVSSNSNSLGLHAARETETVGFVNVVLYKSLPFDILVVSLKLLVVDTESPYSDVRRTGYVQ